MPEIPAHTPGRDRADRWPFFRDRPSCIVLGPRDGHQPSALPPVKIFLGTEEQQYRAERIFFYSVEKVRDPARTYEINLMKNVLGFDRRRWRTGFTNYRYAIPEWAGGSGRAIYNDVDQIYLADPALLFDLEMGNHGYLAISAKDTSVMLIDCGRMVDLWNIETASTLGKHALIDKPSSTPGLWGELDGHWNARDQEYVEGRTKCLHYTALHQQPWQPFPEVFSYHPNPLAYIWHDLERDADAAGYEVFTSDAPSPDLAAALARAPGNNEPAPAAGPLAKALISELEIADVLAVHLAAEQPEPVLPGDLPTRCLVLDGNGTNWPEAAADAVVASRLLMAVPPADLPWLLHRLFDAARKLVHLDATGSAADGLGSADWWRQRIAEIAARHPGKSWSLAVADKAAPVPGTIRHFAMRSRDLPAGGTALALVGSVPDRDDEVRVLGQMLAQGLGLDCVEQSWRTASGNGATSWPTVVVAADRRTAKVALDIKARSGGTTRVVQLGPTGLAFERVDLVVANPAERLPIRANTAQITAPLQAANGQPATTGEHHVLVIGPRVRPFRRTAEELAKLARTFVDRAEVPRALCFLGAVTDEDRSALLDATGAITQLAPDDLTAAIATAARLYTTGEDGPTLSRLCSSGKPVTLLPLPYWYDRIPGNKPVRNALTLLIGGGTSYRGTPHQQHALARLVDTLIVKGWARLPEDPSRLHRSLIARGLLHPLDETEPMASPHPLDDSERVVEAVRSILTRAPATA